MNIFDIDNYITNALKNNDHLFSLCILDLYTEKTSCILSMYSMSNEKDKLIKEYKNIIRMYVPYDILRNLDINSRNNQSSERICEKCENTTDFIRDGNETICRRCYSVITGYRNHFENYDPKYGCMDNVSIHFRNLITKYVYKYSYDLISIENKLIGDFKQFRAAYHELNLDRKNFISHELVLYVILKRNNVKCQISDFDRHKKCHIGICTQVLQKLNWDNYFLRYNKQTMDQLQQYINEFLDNIKSLVTEECHLDVELIKVKLHEAINPHLIEGADTCDPQVNRCTYVLKKGDKQGQECGKRCKSNFCAKHSKRMFKEDN